jgi:hypothetical protein
MNSLAIFLLFNLAFEILFGLVEDLNKEIGSNLSFLSLGFYYYRFVGVLYYFILKEYMNRII